MSTNDNGGTPTTPPAPIAYDANNPAHNIMPAAKFDVPGTHYFVGKSVDPTPPAPALPKEVREAIDRAVWPVVPSRQAGVAVDRLVAALAPLWPRPAPVTADARELADKIQRLLMASPFGIRADVNTDAIAAILAPVVPDATPPAPALPQEVENRLNAILQLAEHGIPSHAYGDSEAACEMAGRLAQIGSEAEFIACHWPRPAPVTADGVAMIAAERARQVSEEEWSPEHDDEHTHGEMAKAAAVYATPECDREYDACATPQLWPWQHKWFKPTPDDRIRELVKAGALIAAEIDRLRRKGGVR